MEEIHITHKFVKISHPSEIELFRDQSFVERIDEENMKVYIDSSIKSSVLRMFRGEDAVDYLIHIEKRIDYVL